MIDNTRRANTKRDDIYIEVEEDSLVDERAGGRRSMPVRPASVSVDESSLGARPSGKVMEGQQVLFIVATVMILLMGIGGRGRGRGRGNILGRMGMRGRCDEKGGRY